MLVVWVILLLVILGLLVYLDWYAEDKLLEVSMAARSDWCGPKEPFDWKQERRIRRLMLVLFGAAFLLIFSFLQWGGYPLGKTLWISLLLSAALVVAKGSFMTYMLLFFTNRLNRKAEKAMQDLPERENTGKLWEPGKPKD